MHKHLPGYFKQQERQSASRTSSRLIRLSSNAINSIGGSDWQLREYAKTGDCSSFSDDFTQRTTCEGKDWKVPKAYKAFMFSDDTSNVCTVLLNEVSTEIYNSCYNLFGSRRVSLRERGDWLVYILSGLVIR